MSSFNLHVSLQMCVPLIYIVAGRVHLSAGQRLYTVCNTVRFLEKAILELISVDQTAWPKPGLPVALSSSTSTSCMLILMNWSSICWMCGNAWHRVFYSPGRHSSTEKYLGQCLFSPTKLRRRVASDKGGRIKVLQAPSGVEYGEECPLPSWLGEHR